MSEPTKTCTKCGETKPESEYYKTGKGDKRHGSCKTCFKARVAKTADPEKKWAQSLKRLYGITSEEYSEMLESQDGVCAICKCPPSGEGRKKRLCVDHNHETGKVRGLPFDICRAPAGLLGEDISRLERAVIFLNNNNNNTNN